MKLLDILVDFDDTLTDFVPAWVDWLNNRYHLMLKPEDITGWDIEQFFPTLTKSQVYEPLESEYFWRTVKPKVLAVSMLRKLWDEGHRIRIVTTSHYRTLIPKMELCLFKHFDWLSWDDVIITSHKQGIKGDILIDDALHNLVGGEYEKILFTEPHNKDFDAENNGMIRANNWGEVYNFIKGIATMDERG